MNPLVSVVMPSFNHAEFVGEAVRSALDQEGVEVEVIVCDDASTDGTRAVLEGIRDPRLKVLFHSNNMGASAAVRPGLAMARGEYVARLSSDDLCLPGRLRSQVEFLRANPGIACVFGQPRFIDERGRQRTDLPPGFADLFTTENGPRAFWLRRFFEKGNCLCLPAAMMRRTVFDDVPPSGALFHHLPDFEFWVRLCQRHEIAVRPDVVTGFRLHGNGANLSAPSPAKSAEAELEKLAIWRHYLTPVGLEALGFPAGALGRLAVAEWALAVGGASHRLFACQTLMETDLEGEDEETVRGFLTKARSMLRGQDVLGLLEKKRLAASKRSLEERVAELEGLLSAWRGSWIGRRLRRRIEGTVKPPEGPEG